MIHIIGGFYKELCLYPEWDYHFGSGGRAAAILSKFDEKICFHSYVHKSREREFKYFSNIYNVDINLLPSTEVINFEYYHALSAPNIHTLNNPIKIQKETILTEDIVICYGMIEAPNPKLNADYLVFDPQSESNPSMIFDNGSIINHLALILNVEEGKKFTSENSIENISKSFFKKAKNLEVLILKDGPFGAHLFYENKHYHIDAYETNNVFKIGSGDVFVAIFGYLWAKDKLNPIEAAEKASIATSIYCENRTLQIDKNSLFKNNSMKKIKANKENYNKRIYLAGPFFTMADRWLIEEAKFQLEKFGANVFSPLHDIGYGKSDFIVKEDLKGIDKADILYAVLNDYDPGTIFEIGYAISKHIPVVIFIENKIKINMTMFEGSVYC